ncbi:FecR family protein [Achromobacter arsenitoxydans]|uniref:FecR family protein n=1 Tax=Achromobacter arsenitoxydans TaxID=1147684 RepID=UPI0005BA32EF|nr:FecR domain-containing protein [Achromobacter arsenitoxydans]
MTAPSPPQFSCSPDDEAITAQAVDWCVRLHDQSPTAADLAAFEAWRRSDPRHGQEYDEVVQLWDLTRTLPSPPMGSGAMRKADARRPLQQRWKSAARYTLGAAASVAAIAVAGWSIGWLPSDYQSYGARQSAAIVSLPEGSVVELNVNTTVTFMQYRDRRELRMTRGEAFFNVSHDADSPLTVHTPAGGITVTGTRFNVWADEDRTVVTLIDGSVSVRTADNIQTVQLRPGMQAVLQQQSNISVDSAAQVEDLLMWRQGKLVLNDLPLREVARLLNHYLPAPQRIVEVAPQVGDLRLGGTYDIAEVPRLLDRLPKVLPVAVRKDGDGKIRLLAPRRG